MDMFPGGKPPMEDFISSWYPILIALSCGVIVAIRSYFKGCPNPSIEKLTDKVVVITGANRGMGKEIALDMALRGAKVYLACRDTDAGTETAKHIISESHNKHVVVMHLDFAKLDTVKQFVFDLKALESKVHLLVNNAGIMSMPQTKTVDGNDLTLQVNYIGPFLLTHLLVNQLIAARPSRVVNMVCHAARIGRLRISNLNHQNLPEEEEYKMQEMYAQSKLALTLFTRQMARYLEGSDVTVNGANPGIVNTGFYDNMPLRQNKFLRWSFFPITWMFMKPPRDGAQTAMYISVAKEEEGVTGKVYNECRITNFEGEATSQELSEALWERTFALAGIKMEVLPDLPESEKESPKEEDEEEEEVAESEGQGDAPDIKE